MVRGNGRRGRARIGGVADNPTTDNPGSSSGTNSGSETNETMRVLRELETAILQQTQQNT